MGALSDNMHIGYVKCLHFGNWKTTTFRKKTYLNQLWGNCDFKASIGYSACNLSKNDYNNVSTGS